MLYVEKAVASDTRITEIFCILVVAFSEWGVFVALLNVDAVMIPESSDNLIMNLLVYLGSDNESVNHKAVEDSCSPHTQSQEHNRVQNVSLPTVAERESKNAARAYVRTEINHANAGGVVPLMQVRHKVGVISRSGCVDVRRNGGWHSGCSPHSGYIQTFSVLSRRRLAEIPGSTDRLKNQSNRLPDDSMHGGAASKTSRKLRLKSDRIAQLTYSCRQESPRRPDGRRIQWTPKGLAKLAAQIAILSQLRTVPNRGHFGGFIPPHMDSSTGWMNPPCVTSRSPGFIHRPWGGFIHAALAQPDFGSLGPVRGPFGASCWVFSQRSLLCPCYHVS
ncbi:hypothetical protein C8R43DRAFT_942504 [Mycena crocata]|nr:hypothetical protein C8R43DRAFT_942504 [Mycena crocata]